MGGRPTRQQTEPVQADAGQDGAQQRPDNFREAVEPKDVLPCLRDEQRAEVGAGSGGFDATETERIMRETVAELASEIDVVLVRYRKRR